MRGALLQPLTDVVVVDFTRYLSGPYCTMILADYGADVVKIERPGTGDESRHMAPFVNGESYPSAMPNRNKRSLALDLSREEGRAVARDLVARADVVVENFRPGVMARLGLDYAAARALNPDVVYCSVTGFGQTGPESHRAGFDIIAQGMTGFLRMTGEPGGEPAKFGVAVNDLVAGMTAATAVLAAYIRRLREGGGQYIDVALVDAGLALTVWEAGAWWGNGEEPRPEGSRHRLNAPYQAFRTQDGYVTVGANNDRLWQRLCDDVLERPDLRDRPEYKDVRDRPRHVDQLTAELQEILSTRPTAHWVAALDRAGVPGGPVLTYSEALAQAQVAAREMVLDVTHPVIGPMHALGVPAKMSETPASVRTPAPLLGQHSREVLRGLGRTDAEIDALVADGVVEEKTEVRN
ncbi:CaiB/BaiF CoA transferase family protein [Pseudonocardia dioxanivorans]|uniref:CaiB/BaiF CoA transferase family protein n=1 Tax=Pseudonocardia dioxanivorans TaxID=240495 RepID=UPI001F273A9C|nr:CoA transferase [Pseudonocardia dioxanivorans]